jgi:hypothetical protein
MKKLLSSIIILLTGILSLQAQPVAEYTYKLDNGISVKTERCWNQVWIQQSYAPLAAGDNTPVAVKIRVLGDLISGSSFKLLEKGKEVKQQGAAPGTYDLKMVFKLSGKPGTLSFVANNIVIKPKTETTVSVTLYDYQVNLQESPGSLKGLAAYDSKVISYKNALGKELNKGVPVFYAKGKHDSPITPDEATNETSGKIKPGTYDIQITISISGQKQKVWLENFVMKPDVNYKITINLNGGSVLYAGGNKDVKMIHLYPAGTSAKQTGNPARVKNIEIASYETSSEANACAPGSYDILLDLKNGTKYEWRKNVAVNSGSRTDIK